MIQLRKPRKCCLSHSTSSSKTSLGPTNPVAIQHLPGKVFLTSGFDWSRVLNGKCVCVCVRACVRACMREWVHTLNSVQLHFNWCVYFPRSAGNRAPAFPEPSHANYFNFRYLLNKTICLSVALKIINKFSRQFSFSRQARYNL